MSLRAPSLQSAFDYICSFDDAIATPPDDAPEEARTAFAAAFGRALETAKWDEVLDPSKSPTRFQLRLIPGDQLRKLLVDFSGDLDIVALSMAVRIGLRGISGLDKVPTFKWFEHERYGSIVDVAIVDFLDSINRDIVNELGRFVLGRSINLAPKS